MFAGTFGSTHTPSGFTRTERFSTLTTQPSSTWAAAGALQMLDTSRQAAVAALRRVRFTVWTSKFGCSGLGDSGRQGRAGQSEFGERVLGSAGLDRIGPTLDRHESAEPARSGGSPSSAVRACGKDDGNGPSPDLPQRESARQSGDGRGISGQGDQVGRRQMATQSFARAEIQASDFVAGLGEAPPQPRRSRRPIIENEDSRHQRLGLPAFRTGQYALSGLESALKPPEEVANATPALAKLRPRR
jgi:hypothetical protein